MYVVVYLYHYGLSRLVCYTFTRIETQPTCLRLDDHPVDTTRRSAALRGARTTVQANVVGMSTSVASLSVVVGNGGGTVEGTGTETGTGTQGGTETGIDRTRRGTGNGNDGGRESATETGEETTTETDHPPVAHDDALHHLHLAHVLGLGLQPIAHPRIPVLHLPKTKPSPISNLQVCSQQRPIRSRYPTVRAPYSSTTNHQRPGSRHWGGDYTCSKEKTDPICYI